MVQHQLWTFLVIVALQFLLVIFVIKTSVWKTIVFHFKPKSFDSLCFPNGSCSAEPGSRSYGFVDLNHADYSWLKVERNLTDLLTQNDSIVSTPKTTTTTGKKERIGIEGGGILTPKVAHKPGDVMLIVFVTTTPQALDKRNLIRSTWGNLSGISSRLGHSYNITMALNATYIVFMVGVTANAKQDEAIKQEANEYGDVIRSPSRETYRNILDKVWFSFEWAEQYQPKYIFKVDDDVYVRLPRFFVWLNEGKIPRHLYAGVVHYRRYTIRNHRDKHYVSIEEFSKPTYPNFCVGACYTFSGNLLHTFIDLSKKVRRFRVEDAYLGLLAKVAEVKPLDLGGKHFVWSRSLARSMKKWADERLSRMICVGDSLTPESIRYIHERYITMDER